MAYNREEFERIDKMELGDLVHYMIAHYEHTHPDYGAKAPEMQSSEYYHAYERLNLIHEQVRIGFSK